MSQKAHNITIDIQYSQEEIIELIKKDLKDQYPNFKVDNVIFNLKDISNDEEMHPRYDFNNVDIILKPKDDTAMMYVESDLRRKY